MTLSMCSKCAGNFLRRTGWPLAASALAIVARARSACTTAAFSSSRVKGSCPLSICSEDCPKRARRSFANWNFKCSIC